MKIATTSLAGATMCLMTVAIALPAHAQYAPPAYAPVPPAYAPPPQQPPQIVTNGPQASPGDASPNWSARRNVVESGQYDQLLETNRGFREARMRKECGPVTDPQLHSDCLASFNQDEPSHGFRR
jgi:hypothetical protein